VKLALLDDNAALDKEVVAAVAEALKRDLAAALADKADWLVTIIPSAESRSPMRAASPASWKAPMPRCWRRCPAPTNPGSR